MVETNACPDNYLDGYMEAPGWSINNPRDFLKTRRHRSVSQSKIIVIFTIINFEVLYVTVACSVYV